MAPPGCNAHFAQGNSLLATSIAPPCLSQDRLPGCSADNPAGDFTTAAELARLRGILAALPTSVKQDRALLRGAPPTARAPCLACGALTRGGHGDDRLRQPARLTAAASEG